MVATRGRTFKRPWRRSCHSSKLKSSSAPIGRKDSWCFHGVGSSNAPLLGSTAAEGLQRIGRTSIATRWRFCGLPQSASCSENFVIPPDVFGQTLMGCPLPEGKGFADDLAGPQSPEDRGLAALALSAMRIELAGQCHARILLGGGLSRFQGLYPGIAEEAYQAVRARRPVYILGGFGGAARSVYEAIIDGRSDGAAGLVEASLKAGAASKEEVRRAHASFVALTRKPELTFDPHTMVDAFSGLGLNGLSNANGLTTDENECLSMTQDVNEINALVIRGLSICTARAKR